MLICKVQCQTVHFVSVACINIFTWPHWRWPTVSEYRVKMLTGTPHGALFHMYRSSDKIGNSYYGYETTGERNWCQWLMSSAPPETRIDDGTLVYLYAPQASESSFKFVLPIYWETCKRNHVNHNYIFNYKQARKSWGRSNKKRGQPKLEVSTWIIIRSKKP